VRERQFALKLMPLLKPDDFIWVHDDHLIPLAAEPRAMECANRIAFFLHVAIPPPQSMVAVSEYEWRLPIGKLHPVSSHVILTARSKRAEWRRDKR
jgi:hypothetical protein